MEDKFEWTDDLIIKFVNYTLTQSSVFTGRYQDIKDFKDLHSPKCIFNAEKISKRIKELERPEYELLQELPNVHKGTIIKLSKKGTSYICKDKNGFEATFTRKLIENNPEWFRKLEYVDDCLVSWEVNFLHYSTLTVLLLRLMLNEYL